MSTTGYIDYILDLLSPFGRIKVRKMFSSYGVYKDGVFFALVVDDVVYFKVDDTNRSAYQKRGSKPFSYTRKDGKIVAMSYWEVPANILEDQQQLAKWIEKSIAVARGSK